MSKISTCIIAGDREVDLNSYLADLSDLGDEIIVARTGASDRPAASVQKAMRPGILWANGTNPAPRRDPGRTGRPGGLDPAAPGRGTDPGP